MTNSTPKKYISTELIMCVSLSWGDVYTRTKRGAFTLDDIKMVMMRVYS